jgi:hypothetical protein
MGASPKKRLQSSLLDHLVRADRRAFEPAHHPLHRHAVPDRRFHDGDLQRGGASWRTLSEGRQAVACDPTPRMSGARPA